MKRAAVFACLMLVSFMDSFALGDKYRICIVDGKTNKKSGMFCPTLDQPDSKVECVIGNDRLDCMRRISKGRADFSIFTPEDLVSAINSEIEVLVTNEMRFTQNVYEYEVVAVISNESGIKSRHDLKGKKLCHPGYGYETDWTNILANFLEYSVIPQECVSSLALTENRIRTSSKFFKNACKAGPWVNDQGLDEQLKRKYPNLCELCYSPASCSNQDKFWGRRGPLFCLTDGGGDIAWARLDDALGHFGLDPGTTFAAPDGYSYLCPDDTIMSANSTRAPCSWVVKPWPVVAAKISKSEEIQKLLSGMSRSDGKWQSALLRLMEMFPVDLTAITPVTSIETYLTTAPGFLSANSFSGCHPPRTIRVCTVDNREYAKCGWMREASAVYAIEPDLDCLRADNTSDCMQAIQNNEADIVIVEPDLIKRGRSKYHLEPLFYEASDDEHKYRTIAVVKSQSTYRTLSDVKGLKACFPFADGVAFNTISHWIDTSFKDDLEPSEKCTDAREITKYFKSVCAPTDLFPKIGELQQLCANTDDTRYEGEYGAMRCLQQIGDVAFMSRRKFEEYFKDPNEMIGNVTRSDYRIICSQTDVKDVSSRSCDFSWAPIGQAMVSRNRSTMWKEDTQDVFLQLDNLFGKNYKSPTTPFTLFGMFDSGKNVIFHDAAAKLKTVPFYKSTDHLYKDKEYNQMLEDGLICNKAHVTGGAKVMFSSFAVIVVCTVINFTISW